MHWYYKMSRRKLGCMFSSLKIFRTLESDLGGHGNLERFSYGGYNKIFFSPRGPSEKEGTTILLVPIAFCFAHNVINPFLSFTITLFPLSLWIFIFWFPVYIINQQVSYPSHFLLTSFYQVSSYPRYYFTSILATTTNWVSVDCPPSNYPTKRFDLKVYGWRPSFL